MAYLETATTPLLHAHVSSEASPQVLNRVRGTILSPGRLCERSIYVHTDDGGFLEVEGTLDQMELQPFLAPGHRVLIEISSADVQIGAPRTRNLYHHNEWAGRVVLSENRRGLAFLTVKMLGQPMTWTSTNLAPWMERDARTWDPVTVSLPPSAVRLVPLGTCARLRMRLFATLYGKAMSATV